MRDLRVRFPRPCGEQWEKMVPAGCARVCERCDKPVHDLSLHTLDEAEALLRLNPDTCVRARIGGDGAVALKPGRPGRRKADGDRRRRDHRLAGRRRAGPGQAGPSPGRYRGECRACTGIRTRVTATGADGRTYRTRVDGNNGRFRIRHLPAGTYSLTFAPSCGGSWTVENIVVGSGETMLPNVRHEDSCIFIGAAGIEENRG